jgi:hypothetical protein
METTMKLKYLALLVFALSAFTVAASQATAKHRADRAQKTKTVKIADRDHDAASDRCERQAGLNRFRRDSDRDGRADGREDSDGDGANNAAESTLSTHCDVDNTRFKIDDAEIVSYSTEAGLTLRTERGGLITAPLAADLTCEQEVEVEDESGDEDITVTCTAADLKPGVEVDDALIKNEQFSRIELDEVEVDDDVDDDDVDDEDDD